ncbi:MAG: hypothetical protein ABI972_05400 [Acidobacteriota bacterium]
MRCYPNATTEDPWQRVTHFYDTNPFDGSFTLKGAGRRTATLYYTKRSKAGDPYVGAAFYAQFVEMFSYTEGGLPIKKRITVTMLDGSGSPLYSNYTEVQYTYDSEGRRTQMVYPKGRSFDGSSWTQDPSRTLNYTYDSMGRPNTMAEPSPVFNWVNSVTDNAASQPTAMSTLLGTVNRTYNILGQLTQITNGSNFSERYDYSATQSNGRITGKKDLLSGEEVLYAYDTLQRLSSAATVSSAWGQSYSYDGWGNLISATLTKGTGPSNLNITVNGLANRINGQTYDANGNQGASDQFDVENRMAYVIDVRPGYGSKPMYYGYDGSNKRVSKHSIVVDGNGNLSGDETLMFYGVGGERLAEFTLTVPPLTPSGAYYVPETGHASRSVPIVWYGEPMDGQRLIEIAKTYVGCHYLNGSYGAYPRGANGDGAPVRPGGVELIADPKRIDPKVDAEKTGFAVKAATMLTKGTQCVCAGSYAALEFGKIIGPDDATLKSYLTSLTGDPKSWPNYLEIYTPRRAYGQGQKGKLVWGEDCTEIRHFDCISYINYCLWKLTGTKYSFEIWMWKDDLVNGGKTRWTSRFTGATVWRLDPAKELPELKDGDIVAGIPANSEHIAFVGSDGTVYQAQDTTMGVHAKSKMSPGAWRFLTRLP